MSKRKSQIIGSIVCPFCLSVSEVCQTEGKTYRFIKCPEDGTINATKFANAKGYQDYISDKTQPIIEGESVVLKIETPEQTPGPEPVTEAVNENESLKLDDDSFSFPWEE